MSYCLAMTKSILSNRKLTLDFAFAFMGMISANCQATKKAALRRPVKRESPLAYTARKAISPGIISPCQ